MMTWLVHHDLGGVAYSLADVHVHWHYADTF